MGGEAMRVVVGLSGGVDSAVAAALLLEAGHTVIGATMRTWDGRPLTDAPGRHGCYGSGELEDVAEAERITDRLGIPLHVLDLSGEFNDLVLDYCARQYQAGLTPNPCVHCNRRMKFELIPRRLRALGVDFDRFATGHYAVAGHDDSRGRYVLRRGADTGKDQSYFLYQLTQEQLARVVFPLGSMAKEQTRARARALGLSAAERPESQDFVAGGYAAILPAPGRPGPILTEEGRLLGEHRGIEHYTVGQRRGLNIAHREPLYVLAIDGRRNALIVGPAASLSGDALEAIELNWIAIPELREPLRVQARIRYRHTPAAATLQPLSAERAAVRFDLPQRAIAPGQAVVFYDGDLVVGGGIIAGRS